MTNQQQRILDLRAQIEAIDKTIAAVAAAGVQRKKIGDREVEFASLNDLRIARNDLGRQLAAAQGTSRNVFVRF